MKLLYYIPHRLINNPIVEEIDPVTTSFLKMFNTWISLADRTATLDIPGVPVYNNSPMPAQNKPLGFEYCANQRMSEIINTFKTSTTKEKLVVLYSGGIDSTLIVCLMIANPYWDDIKDRVLLAFNEDSQVENPEFFKQIILPKFGKNLISSNRFYDIVSNPKYSCITGECADNLFGSLTLKSYMDSELDYTLIHQPWETGSLIWLLNKVEEYRDEREQMLYDLVNASPISIDSNHDFLWWINFTMKWQAVKYRMSMHAPTAEQAVAMAGSVINFFDSEEFQRWALYSTEPKLGDTWASYKLPAKLLINSIWSNEKYLRYKTKWPSLPGITRYNNAWGFLWEDDQGQLVATKDLDKNYFLS